MKASAESKTATIESFPLSPANTKYPLSKDIRQYFSSGSLHHTTTKIAVDPVKAADKKRFTMGDMWNDFDVSEILASIQRS
jgi:hypothetical protein